MINYPFRNLVFEGGGVKGVAYVGALDVLAQRDILPKVERVAGTSAGAIIALLVGLNFSTAEIREIMVSMEFKKFLDSGTFFSDVLRVIRKYGWYKGDFFERWLGELIARKTGSTDSTFADIHASGHENGFREMFFIATNLSTHYAEVFSFEKEHYRNMTLVQAVRRSMSIPLFFKAKRSSRGDVYVDGGLINNYPVKIFDRKRYIDNLGEEKAYYTEHNKKLKAEGKNIDEYIYNQRTLGFRLDRATEIGVFRDHKEPLHFPIGSFKDYSSAIIKTVMALQDNQHIHSDDWHRTVYIDTLGVGTTDFDISNKQKGALIDSGRDGTEAYFRDWYDNREARMLNRPESVFQG